MCIYTLYIYTVNALCVSSYIYVYTYVLHNTYILYMCIYIYMLVCMHPFLGVEVIFGASVSRNDLIPGPGTSHASSTRSWPWLRWGTSSRLRWPGEILGSLIGPRARICGYTGIYIYAYVYIYMCVYLYMDMVYTYMYMYICIDMCVCTHMSTHRYAYV